MCYHFSVNKSQKELEKRFGAEFAESNLFNPIYYANGFEAPKMPVITNDKPYEIQMISWGLIPSWVQNEDKAKEIRFKTLNSRSESIFSKPSYRKAITNKRCLVLADGFFDWRLFKGKKYPYYIYLKSKEAFAFAGIWEQWKNPETSRSVKTFSIITTEANPLVAKIHNVKKRMPVIFEKNEERTWLEDIAQDQMKNMMDPFDEKKMTAYPISKLITVRGVNRNVSEILKEFDYKKLSKL